MASPPPETGRLTYTNEDVMACPRCGGSLGPHLNHVYVAARKEDGEFTNVHVDARSGEVDAMFAMVAPVGSLGEGRRHRIALTGWCDSCQREFAVIFTQHKGTTLVETIPINEGPIYRTGHPGGR